MLIAFLAGCAEDKPSTTNAASEIEVQEAPWFEEIAAQSGLIFEHVSGHEERHYLPEIMSGGAALFDMNGNGWLDAYLVQSGGLLTAPEQRPGNQLFRNLGEPRPGVFEDITEGSGADDRGYGLGVAVGDYDNDGFPDLYVTNFGANVLLKNNGDGTFADVTAQAGVGHDGWAASAAFFDANNNGRLDLFVTNYIRWSIEGELNCTGSAGYSDYCSPTAYNAPAPDALYFNNGDGEFTEVSTAAGLRSAFGNGLGVVTLDYNRDGWIDVFVANDLTPNQLWENQGDGSFRDVAMMRGCAIDQHGEAKAGMGVAVADLNRDGWSDIFVVNLQGESDSLFRNMEGHFIYDTTTAGLGAVTRQFTRFGMAVLDLNNDGLLDIYHANGAVFRLSEKQRWSDDIYAEPNTLLRGLPDGRFKVSDLRDGLAETLIATSRAAAFGDVDNDGKFDILIVNRDGPAHLLRNVAPSQGGGNWIGFRVIDENGRDAYNASVSVTVDDQIMVSDVRSAYSYLAANDPRVHFGLGERMEVSDVTVKWPDGTEQTFGAFKAGQYVTLRRDNGV